MGDSMVSTSDTDDLIYWSDSGDSFYSKYHQLAVQRDV